jgi:hypothetical protein
MLNNTNSLVNGMMAGATNTPDPVVGMGATMIGWTDRHAATVVEVINDKTIVVQQDTATRTDDRGMSDAQDWTFEPNPDAERKTYTKRSNGAWVLKGQSAKGGSRILVGARSEHFDFSF